MLSPQWLDELRARTTLSAVISRTTRLTRAGNEFKACCPFHDEKSPSFTVNDQKGFYHCFGCGAHGDAIRWLTDQRGLSFMDAVKDLAAEAGMDVPAPDPRDARMAEERNDQHDVVAAAQAWFVANLEGSGGGAARAYLAKRGFDGHTIARFGFGFAPDDRQALKTALSRFSEEQLVEAGLRIAPQDHGSGKQPYDRFRGRLMLPIENARGRVIAFGGRILDTTKTDAPKYLNSPETPLFDKGRTLYNLHRAGPAARQSGRLIVVEGYMDVIALSAAGFAEAVAPLGTALTERQIELAWRIVDTPVLCFDGDAAGRRAALRALTRALPLLRPAHSLRFVSLPAGLDPDDLIKRDGPEAMEAVLANSQSLIETLWIAERDALALETPEDKAGLKARLLARVETIGDAEIRALYRRELLDRFSAFAFPRRDWSKHANVHDIRSAGSPKPGSRYGGAAAAASTDRLGGGVSPDLAARHANWNERERYVHRRLGAAIAGGLSSWPEFIASHYETIPLVEDVDTRLLAMADAFEDVGALDCDQLATILAELGEKRPSPEEWDDLRFPFVWPPADREGAQVGIDKAMRLYAGLPAYRQQLARANAALESDLSDENWAEQQRLLKVVMAFEAQLWQMAVA